ncbi:hypothetical protein ACQ4M4_28035 [Leptolyngbya sp. AN02str]|uniref:hypothetical protein n=1 Tax=Leptolyngbya sp. AN02str TaxID=3423363 RepID=UPI003D311EE9
MASVCPFVLMLCPIGRQGIIWQTILHSQGISVIWESSDVDIRGTLAMLKSEGKILPSLLLIDTRLQKLYPYALCRWCRLNCPEVSVVLVNGSQPQVTPPEREWALSQGAIDLFPRLRQDALISSASANARRLLDILGCKALDSAALVTALFKLSQAHAPIAKIWNSAR